MDGQNDCSPPQERQEGILTALLAGFVAGVAATIAMLKLVTK